jgi:hypothetical protein
LHRRVRPAAQEQGFPVGCSAPPPPAGLPDFDWPRFPQRLVRAGCRRAAAVRPVVAAQGHRALVALPRRRRGAGPTLGRQPAVARRCRLAFGRSRRQNSHPTDSATGQGSARRLSPLSCADRPTDGPSSWSAAAALPSGGVAGLNSLRVSRRLAKKAVPRTLEYDN